MFHPCKQSILINEKRDTAVNARGYFSSALSPLPDGDDLSLFHFPRFPKDV